MLMAGSLLAISPSESLADGEVNNFPELLFEFPRVHGEVNFRYIQAEPP